jgi:glycosyltransferase involved in cell wall biosynthesis
MTIQRKLVDEFFFSICIPQYNRTSFLIEACNSLAEQTFKNFEVCISDDCSTDGKEEQLLRYLGQSGLSFVYHRQEHNLKYDGNLRASIGLAQGQYCFLLGNDDALNSPTVLQELYEDMQRFPPVGAVITNFEEFATGKKIRRVRETGILGAGPLVAADNYRNASFVSGIILDGNRAKELATAKWDGSEMYQMYLMSRIVAEGGALLGIDRVVVRKDIQIPGEQVDSYAVKPKIRPCPIIERRHTFHLLGHLVADAIGPYLNPAVRHCVFEKVLRQLLIFTYPFWIFEFRRIQSWNYAAGICLGMRPRNLTVGMNLSMFRRLRLAAVYTLVTVMGLTIPIKLFTKFYWDLHSFAKSRLGQVITGAQSA